MFPFLEDCTVFNTFCPMCICLLARTLIDRLEFHRLNDAYKPALTLAKLILDYLTFSGSQGNEPFLAYLIDMDVLFQQYLSTILRQETEQSRYWTKEEENHSLDLGKKITIRPDIDLPDESHTLWWMLSISSVHLKKIYIKCWRIAMR